MAGSFGFEDGKYDVSMAIGELELLPAVRQAPAESLIVADGFSCREQIAQGTDRQALHLAQVIQMALHEGTKGPGGDYPERSYCQKDNKDSALGKLTEKVLASVGLLLGSALLKVGGLSAKRSGK